jgi:hypothetical protein
MINVFTASLYKRFRECRRARMNNPETLETLGTTQNKGKQNQKKPTES